MLEEAIPIGIIEVDNKAPNVVEHFEMDHKISSNQ